MKYEERDIIRFIEPIFYFCLKRISNRADAEDLAGEIILQILNGMQKHNIKSLEPWVWRIAHNRYARFCEARKNSINIAMDEFMLNCSDSYEVIDYIISDEDEYETVFRYLHTLSSTYKDLLVDYYIGEIPVKALAAKYSLSQTTIKWRLNVSRQKIRERIGENNMDKVYKRINWNTNTCNGSMDSGQYLSNQVARAICEASYNKPLTVEEISLKTGIPTMYIEDALPHLIYGDAIKQIGTKYATDFIILRLKDKAQMEREFAPIISHLEKYFKNLFVDLEPRVNSIGFYGSNFGMNRLGYIALPLALRSRIENIKNSIPNLSSGPYPPRKDGGYGWFIVQEAQDANDYADEYMSGCNVANGETGFIYWYNIIRYLNNEVYANTRWISIHQIPHKCKSGIIPDGILTEDDIIRLIQANLIVKSQYGYKLNFVCFSKEQFEEFSNLFCISDVRLNKLLTDLIHNIKESFVRFVPKRLNSQISQWVSCFTHSIIGYVTDELIKKGVLEKPDEEKTLTNGVFYIEGEYRNV